MTRVQLNCTHCGKRLSRKTARQIDGVVMCSACMFAPHRPASQDAPNSTPELPV